MTEQPCPDPATHYFTRLLPMKPDEWDRVFAEEYAAGRRVVEVVPLGRAMTTAAVFEHRH